MKAVQACSCRVKQELLVGRSAAVSFLLVDHVEDDDLDPGVSPLTAISMRKTSYDVRSSFCMTLLTLKGRGEGKTGWSRRS